MKTSKIVFLPDRIMLALIPAMIFIGLVLHCSASMAQNNTQEGNEEVDEKVRIIEVRGDDENEEMEPFFMVGDPATFHGGNIDSFSVWVQKNLQVPPSADSICGRVIVQFCVDTLGQVCDMEILRGCDEILDHEALRVIQSSPSWKPAKQDGKTVKQKFYIPVVFKRK